MIKRLTLEYWIDDGWYVGRIKKVLGVFSQGVSLAELEENVLDAYQLMFEESQPIAISDIKPEYVSRMPRVLYG